MSSRKRNKRPDPRRWDRACAIFEEALALAPEEARALIARKTRGDAGLRLEVESLLDSHHASHRFLHEPARLTLVTTGAATTREFREGDVVAGFRIVRRLGSGGFGTVYLARQKSLDRLVALKISPDAGDEARTMAQLEHDHIVRVLTETVDRRRGLRLVAMQYVPGASLDHILEKLGDSPLRSGAVLLRLVDALSQDPVALNPGALEVRELVAALDPLETAAWIGMTVADALACAHERGVLHLDVKPANILVSPYGRPLLADFNIARRGGAAGHGATLIGGTVDYMPPEQQRVVESDRPDEEAATLDPRADLYALGRVVERYAGPALPEADPQAARAIRWIVARCTEPDRDRRIGSAGTVARAFRGALELCGILKRIPPAGWLLGRILRHPILAFVVLLLVPNLVCSALSIAYNSIAIVSRLPPEQQRAFAALLPVYNPIFYSVAVAIWVHLLLRLRNGLAPDRPGDDGPDRAEELRALVLSLPDWVVGLTTACWLPSAVLFPLLIHVMAGPVEPAVFVHFFVSFALLWLVTLSYSVICIEFLCLRVLYPRCWSGATSIARRATEELAPHARRVRVFDSLAGLVPLLAAALLVAAGPTTEEPVHRIFVSIAIGLGMAGVLVAYRATEQVKHLVRAFTAPEVTIPRPAPRTAA